MCNDILNIRKLSVCTSDGNNILKDISIKVPRGRIVGIVGPSGCGKTVLLKSIVGLAADNLETRAEEIMFDEKNLCELSEKELCDIRGMDISLILQDPLPSLDPLMKIGVQVEEALKIHTNISGNDARKQAVEMLERVGLDDAESRYDCYPHELSGGQRQRVLLAASMILTPKLLLADEPTTALDISVEDGILELMRDMCEEHDTSILYITHNLRNIRKICDRVYIMRDGEIVEEGATEEVLSHPENSFTKELLEAESELYGVAKSSANTCAGVSIGSEALVSCRHLYKTYNIDKGKSINALHDVSLDIFRGEVLGLSGDSGCGKTTLARTIMNLQKPDSGTVCFDGVNITGMGAKNFSPYRRRMQMVFQESYSSLDPKMTVMDIIAEPLLAYRLCNSKDELKNRVLELLDETGLDREHLYMYPHMLSGGQRQRVNIARSIALSPELIVCDEPVSSLDVAVIPKILDLFRSLKEKHHMTYLFISHDEKLLESISDRIITMTYGRLE